jgi:hypothetical protein
VQFVDFGNTALVDECKIYEIHNQSAANGAAALIRELNSLAIQCRLCGIKPANEMPPYNVNNGVAKNDVVHCSPIVDGKKSNIVASSISSSNWKSDSVTMMLGLMEAEDGVLVQIVRRCTQYTYSVRVRGTEGALDDQLLTTRLIKEGFAISTDSSDDTVTLESRRLEYPVRSYTNRQPLSSSSAQSSILGSWERSVISHLIGPNRFWIQLPEEEESRVSLEDLIANSVKEPVLPDEIKTGDAVMAPYMGAWYRALVVNATSPSSVGDPDAHEGKEPGYGDSAPSSSLPTGAETTGSGGSSTVRVVFVDYGNSEFVSVLDLRQMTEEIASHHTPFAIPCSLSVLPALRNGEPNESSSDLPEIVKYRWPKDAMSMVNELLAGEAVEILFCMDATDRNNTVRTAASGTRLVADIRLSTIHGKLEAKSQCASLGECNSSHDKGSEPTTMDASDETVTNSDGGGILSRFQNAGLCRDATTEEIEMAIVWSDKHEETLDTSNDLAVNPKTPDVISNEISTSRANSDGAISSTGILLSTDQLDGAQEWTDVLFKVVAEPDDTLVNVAYGYVTHVDSPKCFYLQWEDDGQLIEEIAQALANFTPEQTIERSSSWSVGSFCVAAFAGDWYRAKIMSFPEHRSSKEESTIDVPTSVLSPSDAYVLVSYIDYGNSEKVPLSEIYDIPESVVEICMPKNTVNDSERRQNGLAVQCQLYGVVCRTEGSRTSKVTTSRTDNDNTTSESVKKAWNKWSPEAIGAFQSYASVDERFLVKQYGTNEESRSLVVDLVSANSGWKVSDKLVEKGFASRHRNSENSVVPAGNGISPPTSNATMRVYSSNGSCADTTDLPAAVDSETEIASRTVRQSSMHSHDSDDTEQCYVEAVPEHRLREYHQEAKIVRCDKGYKGHVDDVCSSQVAEALAEMLSAIEANAEIKLGSTTPKCEDDLVNRSLSSQSGLTPLTGADFTEETKEADKNSAIWADENSTVEDDDEQLGSNYSTELSQRSQSNFSDENSSNKEASGSDVASSDVTNRELLRSTASLAKSDDVERSGSDDEDDSPVVALSSIDRGNVESDEAHTVLADSSASHSETSNVQASTNSDLVRAETEKLIAISSTDSSVH